MYLVFGRIRYYTLHIAEMILLHYYKAEYYREYDLLLWISIRGSVRELQSKSKSKSINRDRKIMSQDEEFFCHWMWKIGNRMKNRILLQNSQEHKKRKENVRANFILMSKPARAIVPISKLKSKFMFMFLSLSFCAMCLVENCTSYVSSYVYG